MTLLISPYSKRRLNGKPNAKNYPWWKELVALLRNSGVQTIQLGVASEPLIDADIVRFNLSLEDIAKQVQLADGWIAVDNFLPHLGASLSKSGVAIFGKSDPLVFGHPSNINILKDRKYLRERQFDTWHNEESDEDCFERPETLLTITLDYLSKQGA